jgi:hypothetical protein
LDPQDVALYGEGYADYKARMKRELSDGKEESEDDEVNVQECTSDEEEDLERRFM